MNEPKELIVKRKELLLSLIKDVKSKGLSVTKISLEDFLNYLFRSIEYLSGYSEDEVKSENLIRDLYDLRRMFCIICFENRNDKLLARKITEEKFNRWETYFYALIQGHKKERSEAYKKNFDVLKNFFSSLLENETEEKLFEKLSKFPLYEKRETRNTHAIRALEKMSPVDQESRYVFSKEEKEVLKRICLNKMFFHLFVKILLQAIESFLWYSENQIKSATRTIDIVKIRCMTVALLYKMYRNKNEEISIRMIGEVVNKDHASVLHEAKTHNNFIEQDKFYLEEFIKFVVFFFSLFKDGGIIKKRIMKDPLVYLGKDKNKR
jgi:hypothetical protein